MKLFYVYSLASFVFVGSLILPLAADEEQGFSSLFNGHDLSGWDGNPDYWRVDDGVIVGTTIGKDPLAYNQFIIWRGGRLIDFELRVKIRQLGNNSGIQYRSKEFPEVGRWVIGGYQLDVHPIDQNNGQLYEERGRLLIGRNGHSVVVDQAGEKWLVDHRQQLATDDGVWHEYSILAQGNRIEHRIDGIVVLDLVDYDFRGRSLEGLLAFQLHHGTEMTVEIKDVRLKELVPVLPTEFQPGFGPER